MKTLNLKTCKLIYELIGDEFETENIHLIEVGCEPIVTRIPKKNTLDWDCWFPQQYPKLYSWVFAYTLEDILSRPLLEALGKKLGWKTRKEMQDLDRDDFTSVRGYSLDVHYYSSGTSKFMDEREYHAHKILDLSFDDMSKVEEYVEKLILKI